MRRRSIASLLVLVLAIAAIAAPAGTQTEDTLRTPVEHRRPADNTFLTYPEWFLVFSPDEYADFVEDHPPSGFPFLGHVHQLWEGYAAIARAIPEDQPFNLEYHAMVVVIATSTTAEYAARAAYESLIGRVSEATQLGGPTAEDRYGAEIARDYERFLRQRPWYHFDYADALARLWTDVPIVGADPIRKLERRYWLTTEYLLKWGYAWVLRSGAEASYGVAGDTTAVVVDRLPRALPEGATVEARFADGAALLVLPRYEAFGPASRAIAAQHVRFLEIAGNTGDILVTAIVPAGWESEHRTILRQPILTRPGHERVLLVIPVPELAPELVRLSDPTIELEHVFDY